MLLGKSESEMNENLKEINVAYDKICSYFKDNQIIFKSVKTSTRKTYNYTNKKKSDSTKKERNSYTSQNSKKSNTTNNNHKSGQSQKSRPNNTNNSFKSDTSHRNSKANTAHNNFKSETSQKSKRTNYTHNEKKAGSSKKRDNRNQANSSARKKNNNFKNQRKYNSNYHNDFSEYYNNIFLPNIEMLFGQFLFHNNVISWKTLIEAIIWQRNQRPLFGQIAKNWKILSDDEIKKIIIGKNSTERIGDYALRNGFISLFEFMAIIGKQRSLQQPIGEYFINNGSISRTTLDAMIMKQRKHNLKVKYGM